MFFSIAGSRLYVLAQKLIITFLFMGSINALAKPFWTEKSSYVEGERVYFVGLALGSQNKEEGRKRAIENARHEFFEFLGVSEFAGVPFVTQMTFEEESKRVENGVDVYRLMYVTIENLKRLKTEVWKKKGKYSDEEVISAIQKIKASNGKDELAALELHIKLQPRHKALVIGHLKQSYPGWNPILINSLKSVITSRDKSLILKHLKDKTSLITFVLFYGWEKDAQKTLVEGIENFTGYISGEWLTAVINLKDKKTYPVLKNYLVNGWNRHSTYEKIRLLPGMDLSKELPLAWEQAYLKNSKLELYYLTPYVLASGHIPALEYTIDQLKAEGRRPSYTFDPAHLLKRYLDVPGEKQEWLKWWEQNKNNIKFNIDRKKFHN